MNRRSLLGKLCVLILCLSGAYLFQVGQAARQFSKTDASQFRAPKPLVSYAKLPLSFEANQGQTDARVRFLLRGPGRFRRVGRGIFACLHLASGRANWF